jgi:transcriptional regulator with XRE-family HTH domain
MTPNRVIQARFLLGWSTEALARASRISPAQLAAYEAGGWLHPLQLASVSRALRIEGVEFLNGMPTLEAPRLPTLTAEQCRAARLRLGWSQRQLAAECGMPAGAITVFEKSGSISPAKDQPEVDRLAVIRTVLESAGIHFPGDQDHLTDCANLPGKAPGTAR